MVKKKPMMRQNTARLPITTKRWLCTGSRFFRDLIQNRRDAARRGVHGQSYDNPLQQVVRAMGVRSTDKIIPARGELALDPTTRLMHMRFTRPGDDGEFHLQFSVEYTPPYRSPNVAS